MRIRVISFGTNWWTVHSDNLDDPFCFRRRAAWFNSAGLQSGRRLRLCWVYPGHIRFNQTSGFDPEHPIRSIGKTFLSQGPTTIQGRTHLLLSYTVQTDATPDRYLVTLCAQRHGKISFTSRHWMSEGAQPISVSLRGSSFEAMLLLGETDWIRTDLGTWSISADGISFTLQTEERERERERDLFMRYRRGHIALSDTKDVPLLLTIRNARAITYDQICAIAHIDGIAGSKRIVHWRLSRLEGSGLVQRMKYDLLFSQPIFSITSLGLEVLESRGHALLSLPPTTKEIVRRSQILHSVELAGIRIALASKGILRSWKWELEIVSRNLVYEGESTKDFDALAEIVVGNMTKSLGIEFERTLKGAGRYEELRRVFDAERSVDTILYLTPNSEILYLLAVELRDVRKRIGFTLSKTFQTNLLDADVLSNSSAGEVISFREFLLS